MPIDLNLDPDELVVAGDGAIFVSPEGTPFPTDIDTVVSLGLNAAWTALGYMTEAGPRAAFGRNTKDVKAWQSFHALRTLVTETPSRVEFDMRQWNTDTMGVAMGGVVVTSTANGTMLEPEDASFIDIRQLIVYGIDGDKHYAFCFRRTQNDKELQFPFTREDATALGVGMKVLGAGANKSWFLLTDDPAISSGS